MAIKKDQALRWSRIAINVILNLLIIGAKARMLLPSLARALMPWLMIISLIWALAQNLIVLL